ncbi:Fpg/Nei family DNA glycosylase [Roseibium denhamense]
MDGRVCGDVEAYGKHLIYRFEGEAILHIHLGLFGRIRKRKMPEPEPRGAVRIRLAGDTHLVDINGPTACEILDPDDLARLTARIGPDLLRPDADPNLVFTRISKSRSSVGKLLMNQSVLAGIGNIYRSEILWRQRIHPDLPGKDLTREAFDRLWADAVQLLELGVKRNAIITVDNAAPGKGRYRERVNIFGKDNCPACAGAITRVEIDTRKAYYCAACQAL